MYTERLACAARSRLLRQNEAETTPKRVWRARMLKLPRAGRVSTMRLLATMPPQTPSFEAIRQHVSIFSHSVDEVVEDSAQVLQHRHVLPIRRGTVTSAHHRVPSFEYAE